MGKETIQQTFGAPEPVVKKKKKTVKGLIRGPSYWVCTKGHVFEQKQSIFNKQVERLKCTVCNAPIRNKTSKTTYEYFLDKEGRMDKKQYLAKKLKAEKKHLGKADG